MSNVALKLKIGGLEIDNEPIKASDVFEPSAITYDRSGHKDILKIDFASMDYLSSTNLRKMVIWFQEVHEEEPQLGIQVRNVHSRTLLSLVMFRNLLPKTFEVVSAYIPFFCETCSGEDCNVLIAKADLISSENPHELSKYAPVCASCQNFLSSDVDESCLLLLTE
jgi:hypothetical protein